MWQNIKSGAIAFHQSFHKSGTIVFARLQLLAGAIWLALTTVDLAPLINNPKYVALWLVFSGAINEYVRKSRTIVAEDGHLEPRRDDSVNVTVVNQAAPAAPASPVPTDGTTK